MDEPTGFTGVDWQKRRPEKLSADLVAGAGLGPIVECVDAWTEVGDELDALAVAARRAVQMLGEAWESNGAEMAGTALNRVPAWLDNLARHARDQHGHVRSASAAAGTARLTMPAASVVDQARAAVRSLVETSALTAVLTGGLARAHRAEQELSATAARVMADYERASTPAATAVPQRHPMPPLVRPAGRTDSSGASGAAAGAAALGLPLALPRVLGRFRPVAVTPASPGASGRPAPHAQPAGERTEPGRGGAPIGPMAPVSGTQSAASLRGASATAAVPGGAADTIFAATAADGETAAEPLTWAQLATHDGVRVTPGPTTDSDRTPV